MSLDRVSLDRVSLDRVSLDRVSPAKEHEPVLIDLDLARPSADPDGSEPPLWTAPRRRIAVGVAVVVAVSVLAADTAAALDRAESTPPAASRPVTVPVTGAPLAVIGDSLYTTADGGSRLNAYSLSTGRRRWSVAVPTATEPTLLEAGSHLLLTSRPQFVTRDSTVTMVGEFWTAAIEARSGVVRWQHPGTPAWLAPGGDRVAIVTRSPGDFEASVLAVRDVAGGAESAVFGPVAKDRSMSPVYPMDPGSNGLTGMFVREDANGGQLFDLASGHPRRLDLPLQAPPVEYGMGDRPRSEMLLMARGMVLEASFWGGRGVLTGYAGDPPRPRWTVLDVPLLGAWGCGALLCGSDVNESFALDPGTGEIRWRSLGGMLWRASDHRVYSSTRVGGPGITGTGIAVVDATTGRDLLRRDAWRPVAEIEGTRIPILAYSGTGDILAILDAQRLTTYRIAALPAGTAACWTSKTYVTCRVGPDIFRAWRYSS